MRAIHDLTFLDPDCTCLAAEEEERDMPPIWIGRPRDIGCDIHGAWFG